MRKIIFICDKCGKEIDQEWKVTMINDIYDLCPDCNQELCAVVDEWIGKKPEPAPAQKTKRKAVNRVEIDMPKVHALLDAGWSYYKIGEKFGVSGQTISNRLKEEN